MNETTIEKIEKEIDEKIKLPKDIKENIIKEVFTNIVMAIGIMVYLTFLILGSVGAVKNIRIIDFNIFSIILLGISILLFEIAWKRSSGRLSMYGIEMLAIALFTLFLPYIIFELNSPYKKFYLIASAYTTMYYSIKSIYIAIKSRRKYMITVDDIKDIVKKEKIKRVINDDIEETEEIEVVEEIDNKDTLNGKGENTITDNKPKKRGRPKKIEDIKSKENIAKEDETPKRRGRPRKVVTND